MQKRTPRPRLTERGWTVVTFSWCAAAGLIGWFLRTPGWMQ